MNTNVLAYLYLPGEFTSTAEALLEHDPDWAAPILWRSEFRNILAGHMRRNSLTFDQAHTLQSEAEGLLAGCEFIALAQTLGTKLVTMDAKLLKAFPKVAVRLAG